MDKNNNDGEDQETKLSHAAIKEEMKLREKLAREHGRAKPEERPEGPPWKARMN